MSHFLKKSASVTISFTPDFSLKKAKQGFYLAILDKKFLNNF